jgi:hypothetical protein
VQETKRGKPWDRHSTVFLSVSWTHVPAVRRYLTNPEAHHHKIPFVDELKRLLEKNGVKYDPKYLL